jgi:hypothetical protein
MVGSLAGKPGHRFVDRGSAFLAFPQLLEAISMDLLAGSTEAVNLFQVTLGLRPVLPGAFGWVMLCGVGELGRR